MHLHFFGYFTIFYLRKAIFAKKTTRPLEKPLLAVFIPWGVSHYAPVAKIKNVTEHAQKIAK